MKPVNCVSLSDVKAICNAIDEDNGMFVFSATAMKMVLAALDTSDKSFTELADILIEHLETEKPIPEEELREKLGVLEIVKREPQLRK